MNRPDIFLAVCIGAIVLGASALFLSTVSAAAHGSVFNVTDPDRGLFQMHPELVKEQP